MFQLVRAGVGLRALLYLSLIILATACKDAAPNPDAPTRALVTPAAGITLVAPRSPSPTGTRSATLAIPPTRILPATFTPIVAPIQTVIPGTTTLSNDAALQNIVALIHEHFAVERQTRGLKPLQVDAALAALARTRSQDMIARNYFGHHDPETGAELVSPLLEQVNFRWQRWGENIIEQTGFRSLNPNTLAREFAVRWLASPGHAQNILDENFSRTGIGAALSPNGGRIVVTQIFAD